VKAYLYVLAYANSILGSSWAGLVPTVTAVAAYFCVADFVLIAQCLYYNYFRSWLSTRFMTNEQSEHYDRTESEEPHPESPLLGRRDSHGSQRTRQLSDSAPGQRRRSTVSLPGSMLRQYKTVTNEAIKNLLGVLGVCAVGTLGWFVAWKVGVWQPTSDSPDHGGAKTPLGAEVLGWISALCYLW
jgi:hypothetical protein